MNDLLGVAFNRSIENLFKPSNILKRFLVQYLKLEQIYLLPYQIAQFCRSVENDKPQLKLYWFNTLRSKLDKHQLEKYLNSFFAYLETEVDKYQKVVFESIEDVTSKVVESTAKKILSRMYRTSAAMTRNRSAISREHRKTIKMVWGDVLHVLRMIVEMSKEIHEELASDDSRIDDDQWVAFVKLFEQACLVSTEILFLLENGFPDAALARWRTLHEISVIFLFLQENATEVSTMFIEHLKVSNYKEMILYTEKQNDLGFRDIDSVDRERIEEEYRQVIDRFGANFKNDYGWASSVIASAKIHFHDIEKYVRQDYLKPFYKMACNNVHAGVKGLFYKIGAVDHYLPLVGQSFVGLADPIQLTTLSLCSTASGILAKVGTLTSTVEIQMLSTLSKNALDLIPELIQVDDE